MRNRVVTLAFLGAISFAVGCGEEGKSSGGGATSGSAAHAGSTKKETKGPASATSASATAATSTTAPPEKKWTLAEVKKDGGKRAAEAFSSHDPKKAAALYAENAVIHQDAKTVTGRAAIEKEVFADELFKFSTDIKLGVTRTFWKGNQAVSEWVMTGTNNGDTKQGKATGKPFGMKGANVLTFNDAGEITEEWLYMDNLTMAAQLGLMPMPDAPPPPALPTGAAEAHEAKDGDAAQAKNLEVLTKMLAAENAGKWDDLLALWADNGSEWSNVPPWKETPKKDMKAGMASWYKTFKGAKTDQKLAFATDGDFVVARDSWTATFGAPLSLPGNPKPIPPTNKPVTLNAVYIFHVANGKVDHSWMYADGMELLGQLGIPMGGPAPAASGSGSAKAPTAPAPTAAPKK